VSKAPRKDLAVFEEPRLGTPQQRKIVLQTHLGTEIENEIAVHPVPEHAALKFFRLVAQHPDWKIRKPPTGIYNCVGHVWASRRTAVYEKFDEAVLRIRDDDGYRAVDWNKETPLPGDVACYWESINPYKNCMHVGQVIGLGKNPRPDLPPPVFVLSKWDDVSGEVVHLAPIEVFGLKPS
jgi:hypothetical protein